MLHLHKLSSLLRGFMVTVIQGILGSKLLLHLTQLQFAMTVISKSFLILIWNIGHVLTFSFFPQENLSNLCVEADYLPVLNFLWKAMVLEQNNFCTRKVSFHRVGREVILQTILPMDLCSPFFFSSRSVSRDDTVLTVFYIFDFKNKIPSTLVEDGQWSVRRWGPLLSSLFTNFSEPKRFHDLSAEE